MFKVLKEREDIMLSLIREMKSYHNRHCWLSASYSFILPSCLFKTKENIKTKKPTPVSLPGKFHGQKSLAGYSPWVCKESDMTERLKHTHQVLKICVTVTGKSPEFMWFL